jgi:hypothetical protein
MRPADALCNAGSNIVSARARVYRAAGLAICKPDHGTKKPSYTAWPTRSLEPEDFAEGDLLGILGGPLSDCNRPGHALVIIDLDAREALEKADAHLPCTRMIDGRPGKPSSHRYYVVPLDSIPAWGCSQAEQGAAAAREEKGHPGPFLKHFRHAETQKGVLDFIGTGGQVVCPPSRHPLGEVRDWLGGELGRPAVVPFEELWDAICRLALACGCKLPFEREEPGRHAHFHHQVCDEAPVRVVRRAIAYLAKVDAAVSGKGGHDATYWPARVICWGFGLGCERGFQVLWEHFNPRCDPPWSEAELRHKCRDADTLPFGKPRGWLLEERPRHAAASHANGKLSPPAPDGGGPDEPDGEADTAGGYYRRPVILITTERKQVNDAAVAALAAAAGVGRCELYYRGGMLVRVIRDRECSKHLRRSEEALRIAVVGAATLGEEMAAAAYWGKVVPCGEGKAKQVPAHPPDWAIKAVHERESWPGIRRLAGIVEAPTLRPDGTILNTPGYDPGTRLVYEPAANYPPIPETPGQEDARRAARDLLALVDEFPFVNDDHKAVWLAAVLTVLARPAIAGPCPLFLFEAPAAGSGKTLLAELVGLISTGREVSVSELSDDNEEVRKSITAILLEGERLVLLDNASGGFGCKALDAAITGTTYKGRILGKTKRTPEIPIDTIWMASGNKLHLRGDTHRRVLPCRIVPLTERPEERANFRIPNLKEHVRRHRADLVVAALTVLRAHALAGRPAAKLPAFGAFEAWSAVVRQAVHWSTGHDPHSARSAIQAESRSNPTLVAVLQAWSRLLGGQAANDGITSRRALELAGQGGELYDALLGWGKDGKLPDADALGYRLRAARDKVAGAWILRSVQNRDHVAKWWVEPRPACQQGAGAGDARDCEGCFRPSRARGRAGEGRNEVNNPSQSPASPAAEPDSVFQGIATGEPREEGDA